MGRLGMIALGLAVCLMLGGSLASVGRAAAPEAAIDRNLVRA